MHLTRKLLLLGTMALAALALTAGSASAQLEVHAETDGAPCGDVGLSGHVVTGGCHIEFESTADIPLFAYIPAKTQLFSCEVYLEGRVGEDGEGYVTQAILDSPDAGGIPCTRAACDEDAGAADAMRPWPLHIQEHGPSSEELEMTFCLRTIASGEGGAGTPCEIHLELTDLGGHQYELGHGTETFCENSPPNPEAHHPTLPFPISINAHLQTHVGGETIEIVH